MILERGAISRNWIAEEGLPEGLDSFLADSPLDEDGGSPETGKTMARNANER